MTPEHSNGIPVEHRHSLNASVVNLLLAKHQLPQWAYWYEQLANPQEHQEDLDWLLGPHKETLLSTFQAERDMQPEQEYRVRS